MMSPMFRLPLRHLPGDRFLDRLETMTLEGSAAMRLADRCPDTRLNPEIWRLVVQSELMHLRRWSFERLLSAAVDRDVFPQQVVSEVVCLLPRYGLLTHLIRRALPFAACDIKTVIAIPACAKDELRATLDIVAESFGVEPNLRLASGGGDGPAALTDLPHALVVVTGRLSTVSAIWAGRQGGAGCLGAAGRCAVIVAETGPDAARLVRLLARASPMHSCTRPRAAFCLRNPADRIAATTLETLAERLPSIHPSVILAPTSLTSALSAVTSYTVLACDPDGRSDTHNGLARDPRFGWPGDYCL